MKKLLLFLLLIIGILQVGAQEDTIRHLIFTEWRGNSPRSAYVELTNVGNVTVDLSKFTLTTVAQAQVYPQISNSFHMKRLEGSLSPGQSYLIMNVYEGIAGAARPITRTQMLPLADLKVYVLEGGVENDSISPFYHLLRLFNGTYASVLWYNLANGDSVIVDAVANDIDLITGKHKGIPSSVAGVESATDRCILVRKANITRGNPNWDNARGVSLEDSEWLPVFHDGENPDGSIFTTVKVHGVYKISLESQSIGINITDTILTVPWGVLKGDSLLKELTLGPNMAWGYYESSNPADSAYNIARTGDKLSIYAFSNQIQQMDFKIFVSDPANDMAKVFPLRNKDFTTGTWTTFSRYYVTENSPVIDTIGNVPFATRVDTLFTYLLKTPQASWEIIWVDGKERVDLKHGDILKVIAQDGTTVKEYFIDVQEYVLSSNASLSAITWPDMPYFLDEWKEDTIPFFVPNRYSYYVKLPYGTTNIPALVANTQSLNAKVKMKRAVSLKGRVEDRTTVFTVTAQDDSTILTYSVLFDVYKIGEQIFRTDPFFSQIIHRYNSSNSFLEITNAGNVPISLDNYMVVQSDVAGSPAAALQANLVNDEANWNKRYYKYVPGYRFQPLADWIIKPGMLNIDPTIDPILDPGEVFVIGRLHNTENRRPAEVGSVDIHFSGTPNIWGESGWSNNAICWTQPFSVFYLFKIENDSVLDGTKPVGDPNDYSLVDMFGSSTAEIWTVAGMSFSTSYGFNFIRKPFIWKGNPESTGSYGTTPENSEWNVVKWAGSGTPWPPVSEGLGTHSMDPTTVYISTVTSNSYIVSDGYEELQSIQGDLSGKTLTNFYEYIIKGDTTQQLTMKSNVNGSVKSPDDLVAGGDTLVVVSADGKNTTRYLLLNQPIDNNATLTVVSGSGLEISINEDNGTITGFNFGTSIDNVLLGVIKPTTAILNIINGNDELVSLSSVKTDSVKIKTLASDNVYFEVIAQNGVDKITYQLKPTLSESDAYVLSDIYTVLQDSSAITGLLYGTSVTAFFNNILVVKDATAKIINKSGEERINGNISFDDLLAVTSKDKTTVKVYYLQFYTEPSGLEMKLRGIPEAPAAMTLVNVSSTGTEATIQWTDKSDFETGFVVSRDGTIIDTIESNTFTYHDLVFATEYEFGVYAYNELGNSGTSKLVILTFPTSVNPRLNKIGIYPTITTGFVRITGLSNGNRIVVSDILGKIISQKLVDGEELTLNLQTCPSGIYIISVIDKQAKKTSVKIFKE